MPSRLACIGILLLWAVASVCLIRRDILPELLIGPPPNLRSIASADPADGPTRWSIMVADDKNLQSLRPVGQAVTESKRLADGQLRLEGKVWFEAKGLLEGTPFASKDQARIEVDNVCDIDLSGNLKSFRAVVRADGAETPLLTLNGEFKNRAIEVKAQGPIPPLNFTKQFPYEPKTMIQNVFGPIDRMPGLAVGQRWEARSISPLTGMIDVVKAEVVKKSEIYWDKSMVATLEVVQKIPPAFSARSWVRKSDGLVLRQEVPFPFVTLIIERLP